jgi:hypothetical protein
MKSAFAVLAALCLICSSAWAQVRAGGGEAYVDSREECTALGGAWLSRRGTFLAACQVPWKREECLRLGGAWSPLPAAPDDGVCVAAVSQTATARQCADSGGTWGPPGSAMPFCQPGPAKAAAPARPASDANKVCESQTQCIYGCVYRGPEAARGAEVKGRCRTTPQVSGCDSMVDKGRLAGTICKR